MSKCIGCGAILQNENENEKGYVVSTNSLLCKRCFDLKNYNKNTDFESNFDNDLLLKNINKKGLFTIFLCDIISLNDKVAELQPIVDKYNDKMAKEEEEKNAQLVNEKREYYKNKFEQLGARSKFESEEVQNLINNCIKDDKSMSKLNLMIVDLISVENAKPKAKTEKVADMDNLLVIEEDITSKYGFR